MCIAPLNQPAVYFGSKEVEVLGFDAIVAQAASGRHFLESRYVEAIDLIVYQQRTYRIAHVSSQVVISEGPYGALQKIIDRCTIRANNFEAYTQGRP